MTNSELVSTEFDQYYQRYIDKLKPNTALIQGFEIDQDVVINFFEEIPNDKYDFRYEPKKWSIKEVLQHMIDVERVFMHRCFRIARRDQTPLSGFDQDIYIEPSQAASKTMAELLEEFKINRAHSISFLSSLSNDNLNFIGNANDTDLSARAAAFIILGHDIWHMEVLKEKYL